MTMTIVVTECMHCPFAHPLDDYRRWCRMITTVVYVGAPPNECPLRSNNILVSIEMGST